MLDIGIATLSITANLLLGLLIYVYNSKPLVNKIFLFAILFIILFTAANYRIDTATTAEDAFWALKFFIIFGHIFTYFFFLFVLLFPTPDLRKQIFNPLHVVTFTYALIVVPAIVLSNAAATGVVLGPNGLEHIDFGPLYLPMFIGIFALTILNFAILRYRYTRTHDPQTKRQLACMSIGWSLFISLIIVVGGIIPYFVPAAVNLSKIIPLFSVFMVGSTTYAIIKHQFLDIRVIIQRGIQYSFLFGCIALVYILILQILNQIVVDTEQTAFVSALITTILGIATVPYIDRYFRKVTDPIFFKDRYNYADALYTLSEQINSKLLFEDIKIQLEEILATIFKARSVSVTLVDTGNTEGKEPFTKGSQQLTVPIVLNDNVIGYICLDEKLSGDPYTTEDNSLLKTFAHQVALAFEKARLYKEVQDYSETLEERVRERTEQIKMLQEEQNQMMLDIAHNLQSPLTYVRGEADFLQKHLPPDKSVSVFIRSIDDVSEFVYKLLRLARLGTQSVEKDRAPLNLSELVSEHVDYFQTIAEAKGISLTSHIDPNISILGHEDRLKELITNLVSNAIKYIGKRERVITITLTKQHGNVVLSVSDTGIGIDEDHLPHIFDRFYRIRNDNGTLSGTGLGLAICKRIAELHDGSIAVTSKRNKGTTFTITFGSVVR